MTRKILVIVAVAVGALTLGCGSQSKAPLGPKAVAGDGIVNNMGDGDGTLVKTVYLKGSQIPAALRSTWIGDNDLVLVKVATQAVSKKGDPSLATYFKVLYVCDWIRGRMYGPPGPGHCWDDGMGCTPNWGPDPYTATQGPIAGDPDEPGDHSTKGDPDGTGVKALGDPNRAIQFGPPPSKGDPTADD